MFFSQLQADFACHGWRALPGLLGCGTSTPVSPVDERKTCEIFVMVEDMRKNSDTLPAVYIDTAGSLIKLAGIGTRPTYSGGGVSSITPPTAATPRSRSLR